MITVVTIVEGHGEVAALPTLLRRLGEWKTPETYFQVPPPIRVRRDRFLNRQEEFQRYLYLAAAKSNDRGWILILLDADDDCPADLGAQILEKAKACAPHRRISVVLANREYEAWFIAAAESLNGYRGFVYDPAINIDAEVPRNAKGWVSQHMAGNSYSETTDQPAFSACMNLEQAFNGSRSFRKLCNVWETQMLARNQ